MISHLINLIFIGVLVGDMIERRFPDQSRKMFMEISFNCIYLFSKFQIFTFKIYHISNKLIETNPALLKIKNDLITIINNILSKINDNNNNKSQYVKHGILYDSINDYDFIIRNDNINDNINDKCVVKRIFYENNYQDAKPELSDIRFMLIEFKVGENQSYKIDLKTEYYNYYVIGNRFTKDFFIFYLKHYLQFKNDIKDIDKCSLKIIDHDVNKIELDFTDKNDSILLEKSGYKLSIANHIEEKE
jgi:hypothetical protein